MTGKTLAGARILVVEDEYLIADDLREALSEAGLVVLGPVPTAQEARALLDTDAGIDAVLLDINLRNTPSFPLADELREGAVPFAFVTGYDRSAFPPRFADVAAAEKPLTGEKLTRLLQDLLDPGAANPSR